MSLFALLLMPINTRFCCSRHYPGKHFYHFPLAHPSTCHSIDCSWLFSALHFSPALSWWWQCGCSLTAKSLICSQWVLSKKATKLILVSRIFPHTQFYEQGSNKKWISVFISLLNRLFNGKRLGRGRGLFWKPEATLTTTKKTNLINKYRQIYTHTGIKGNHP